MKWPLGSKATALTGPLWLSSLTTGVVMLGVHIVTCVRAAARVQQLDHGRREAGRPCSGLRARGSEGAAAERGWASTRRPARGSRGA